MRERTPLTRLIAAILAAALVWTAPGLGCYSAFAEVILTAPVNAGRPVVPVVSVLPNASFLPSPAQLQGFAPLAGPSLGSILPGGPLKAPSARIGSALGRDALPFPTEVVLPVVEGPASPIESLKGIEEAAAPLIEMAGSLSADLGALREKAAWEAAPRDGAPVFVQGFAGGSAVETPAAVRTPAPRRLAADVPGPGPRVGAPLRSASGADVLGDAPLTPPPAAAGWLSRAWTALTGAPTPALRPLASGVTGVSEDPARKLERHIVQNYEPGNAFNEQAVRAALKKIGLPGEQAAQAVAMLASERKLLEVAPDTYLLVLPAQSTDAGVRQGNAQLKQAVEAYDSQDAAALSKAVDLADAAERAYAGAGNAQAAERNRKLASMVKVNAAIAMTGRLLAYAAKKAPKLAERVENARREYFDGAFISLNTNVRPPAPVLEFLRQWLEGLNVDPAATDEDVQRMGRALQVARKYFGNLRPRADNVPTTPAPDREGGAAQPPVVRLPAQDRPYDTSKLKALNEYGLNLTDLAAKKRLRPLIGRRAETDQVIETLVRWTKNNPVLIGEHGVGKTQIVEGLAQRIVAGVVPEQLKGKVIYRLDLGALNAGTQFRGEFEQRMVAILKEVAESEGRILLFIDEIHRIMGMGTIGKDKNGADNMIKEALQSGKLTVIGATTLDEYRAIEKDGALNRRFKPITVKPPTREDAIAIVRALAPRIAEHHRIAIDDEAIVAAVDLSDKHIQDRFQPDKAIDLLDEAAAFTQLRKPTLTTPGGILLPPTLTVDEVALKVSQWTGVPAAKLTQSDRESLKALDAEMKRRLIHQDEAVAVVAAAIRRNKLGYKEKKRPVGSFLFLGRTGTGKTELARVLARTLFGKAEALHRIDMSEYMEKASVSRLIGAPPGYIGHDNPGQLTEKVRRQPYSVLLFDEVEKAHEDVLNVLLQILEEGTLTDGQGRTVDFSNTIVIMTSNVGAEIAAMAPKRRIGFYTEEQQQGFVDESHRDQSQGVAAAAKARFRPELLNRLDALVTFNTLDRGDIDKILDIQLGDLKAMLEAKKLSVTLSDAARRFLVDRGFDPVYGARPLKRAIEKELKDRLVDAELDGVIKEGDTVVVDLDASGKRLAVRPVRLRRMTPGGDGVRPLASGVMPAGGSAPRVAAVLRTALAALAALALPGLAWAAEVAAPASGVSALGGLAAPVWETILAAGAGVSWTLMTAVAGLVVVVGATLLISHRAPALALVSAKLSWKPVLKAGVAAAALDLGLKALAYLIAPTLGVDVVEHILPMSSRVISALATGALVAGFSYGLKRWGAVAAQSGNAVLGRAFRIQQWVAGIVFGSTIGQSLEAFARGLVADWIPLGGIVTNVADLAIWLGVSYTVMSAIFFALAQRSETSNTPITMPTFAVYLPVMGAMLASLAMGLLLGAAAPATVFIYALFIGLGVLVADAAVHPLVKAYNKAYRQSPGLADDVETFTLPRTFRLKRQLFALLASTLGIAISAPTLPAAQVKQMLERLQEVRPRLLILDYDWVLATNDGPRKGGTPALPEMVQALEQVIRAGVTVAIATDRHFEDRPDTPDERKSSIAYLLVEQMRPEFRRNIIVAVDGGSQIFQYNAKGDKPKSPLMETPPFSQFEQDVISQSIRKGMEKLGLQASDIRISMANAKAVLVLETEDKRGKIEALAKLVRRGLKDAGVNYPLQVKFPMDPTLAPYFVIRKADKSASVQGILKVLSAQGEYVDPAEILIMGDETDKGGLDLTMAQAAPQALMISVGKKLDPRYPNAYLWPEFGPKGTLQVLHAIGEGFNGHVFSYTQLALRERSVKEFKARYARLPSSYRGDSPREPLPVFVGNRVHQTLHWLHLTAEGLDLRRPGPQAELLEKARLVYDERWKESWNAERVDLDAVPPDGLPEALKDLETAKDRNLRVKRYKEHGWAMIERYIKTHMPFKQSKTIAAERLIHYSLDVNGRDYRFIAKPDRLALASDGFFEVHDYKSGRTLTLEQFKADLQQSIYLFAARKAWPQYRRLKPRFIAHYPDTDVVWEPTERELEAARLRIAAMCEQILKDLDEAQPAAEGGPPQADAAPDADTLSALPRSGVAWRMEALA